MNIKSIFQNIQEKIRVQNSKIKKYQESTITRGRRNYIILNEEGIQSVTKHKIIKEI